MKPHPAEYAVQCVEDRWFMVTPDDRDFRARTYERRELHAGVCIDRYRPTEAATPVWPPRETRTEAGAARGGVTEGIRIIRHEGVKDSGSFEVRLPDGRREFYYWDDVASRRLRPDDMTSEQALEKARRSLGRRTNKPPHRRGFIFDRLA